MKQVKLELLDGIDIGELKLKGIKLFHLFRSFSPSNCCGKILEISSLPAVLNLFYTSSCISLNLFHQKSLESTTSLISTSRNRFAA